MMASLEELLAKLEEILARRRATNIHRQSASADSSEVTANDGSAVTEEAADDGTTVVNGVGINDTAATPNIITAEQQITNELENRAEKVAELLPFIDNNLGVETVVVISSSETNPSATRDVAAPPWTPAPKEEVKEKGGDFSSSRAI
ncbi:unnamed protein product [Linum trigynum]|uniref:Uncharacterized protein n=1 Tax=Linum trigynum TaxID=586398 RepID=A0AAV2GRY4_9ROSI